MKRSFPINLAGRVFYIDEDAYTMLDNYLTNLTITFGAEDDREIVIDIENRISEILHERVGDSSQRPITIGDVNHVIDVIGSPEQVADNEGEYSNPTEPDGQENATATPPPFARERVTMRRRLYRDVNDKVLGGVVSGVCVYCGWSVTPARIVLAVAALCFPILVLAYLLAWMLIPPAVTAEQRLEMCGREVNIDNIGRTVQNDYARQTEPRDREVTVTNVLSVFAKIGLAFLALVAFPVAFGTLVTMLCSAVGLVAGWFMSPAEVMDMCARLDLGFYPPYFNLSLWTIIVWCAVAFIPAMMVIWGACTVFFKSPSLSRGLILASFFMEVILVVIGIVLSVLL